MLKAANSVVSGLIWRKFEVVRDFMHVLITSKYKKDRIKFPYYKSMGAFYCHGHQTFDPICLKTLCSLSPPPVMLHIKFDQGWPTGLKDIQVRKCNILVIQGQVTPKLVVWSGLKSNSDDDDGRTTDHWYTISLQLRWAKKWQDFIGLKNQCTKFRNLLYQTCNVMCHPSWYHYSDILGMVPTVSLISIWLSYKPVFQTAKSFVVWSCTNTSYYPKFFFQFYKISF